MLKAQKHLFVLLSSTAYMAKYINWEKLIEQGIVLMLLTTQEILQELDEDLISKFEKILISEPMSHVYKKELNFTDICLQIDEIIKYKDIDNFDFYSFNEFNVENVAKLRAKYKSEPFKSYSCYRNKLKMRKLPGVKFPKAQPIDFDLTESTFEEIKNKVGFPFIVKPVDGAGSFDVKLIKSQTDFEALGKSIKYYNDKNFKYLAEEYLEGDLYHADLIYSKGKIIFEAVSKYNYPLSYFNDGYSVGSITIDQNSEIAEELKKLNQYLIPNDNKIGTLHSEFFVTDKGVYLLETAHRPPGGPITKMYESAFGINILEMEIYALLDLEYKFENLNQYAFWIFVPPTPGKIEKLELPKLTCNHQVQWYVKEGQVLKNPKSLRDKIASIVVFNKSQKKISYDFLILNSL